MSTLEDEDAGEVRDHFLGKSSAKKPAAKTETKPAAKKTAAKAEDKAEEKKEEAPESKTAKRPAEDKGKQAPAGAEGKPVRRPGPVGPDGKPLKLAFLWTDGRPLQAGPDGKPVKTGPDGRPLGPDGKPLRQRALGPDGKPLRRVLVWPDGSPLKTGPDGKPVAPDGKPLQMGPDGRPLGPDGKPLRQTYLWIDGKPLPVGPGGQAPKRPSEDKTRDTAAPAADAGSERPAREPAQKPEEKTERQPQKAPTGRDGAHPSQDRGQTRPDQGQRGDIRKPFGDRQGRPPYQNGQRPAGSDQRSGDRPYGGRGPSDQRRGSYGQSGPGRPGGYGSGFSNDRNGAGKNDRRDSRGPKPGAKPEMSNDTDKTRRDNAYNSKKGNKDRDKKRRGDYEDGFNQNQAKPKKDPNRKGAFIKPEVAPKKAEDPTEIKTITLPDPVTIKELADKLKQPTGAIIKKLFLAGKIVMINSEISFEEAEELALEYNCIAEHEVKVNVVEELLKEEEEDESLMVKRPPVVCVMGHVDHGKTSLLDRIRETNVTDKEAGGITQHIGAYVVEVNGRKITFLDTPGHEAFTSMRMRGAKSTDIAILVVAADDGVMPQTVEAINHAKAANVQIIVAVNKIDKPGANVERVKQELTEHGLTAEEWGGETVFCPVSAKTGEGIENLLEMILLTADVCELKANPNRKARGIVIEAELDKGKGPVATILVQKGTLEVGDNVAIGATHGKVRAMMDHNGKPVKKATPSTPVEILGLNGVPNAGEVVMAVKDEKEARTIAEAFISQSKENLLAETKKRLSLDGLFSQIQAGNIKELNIIIKADVQGSVEAVRQSLEKLSNEEVVVRVIHGGVGAINESDINLASASNAIIIGFNVKPDNTAKDTAERENVEIKTYKVIYNAIEDVENAMKGMLKPIFREKVIGHAEVRQTFKASGLGVIAGSYVLDGKIQRGCSARITREGEQIYEGPLASLKRFKDDVKEVDKGYECGLVFEKFNDLMELDQIEFYVMEEVPR
ncbi:MAG: translation initiation factor IF-2 [Lachnospiraceae bacterium]|nr:translation initiation factor IF-2 [Lachnospiraceae bacterium]